MRLLLERFSLQPLRTFGVLRIDGLPFCATLEDTDRHLETIGRKIAGQTAIPRGIYEVTIDFSNRFQRPLPHVLNVPQFDGIRIHAGNSEADTEGCILVGQGAADGGRRLMNSRPYLDRLMVLLDDALRQNAPVTLEVR